MFQETRKTGGKLHWCGPRAAQGDGGQGMHFSLCEFKNYTAPIHKDEVNQVANYLKGHIGRLCFLLYVSAVG
jgi:hypothetical protein